MNVGSPLLPILAAYRSPAGYHELVGFGTEPLPHRAALHEALGRLPAHEWQRRAGLAERVFHDVGVTFTLTADEEGVERTIPFDPMPRLVATVDGRDYADVTPIKGSYRGSGASSLDVDVTVGAGRQAQQ